MKKLNLFFFAGLLLQGSLYAPIHEAVTYEYENKRVTLFGAIHKGDSITFESHQAALVRRSFEQVVRMKYVAKWYEDPLTFFVSVAGLDRMNHGLKPRVQVLPGEYVCYDGKTVIPAFSGNEADGLAALPGGGTLEFRRGSPLLLYSSELPRLRELSKKESVHSPFYKNALSVYSKALVASETFGNCECDSNLLANNLVFDSYALDKINRSSFKS